MGKSKKRKREMLEAEYDATLKNLKLEKQTTPSELVTVAEKSNDPPTAVAEKSNDLQSAEVLPDGDLGMIVGKWLNELEDKESQLIEELVAASDAEDETANDMKEILNNIEVKIRDKLRGLNDDDKSKAFRYECEWKGCVFMSGKDRQYFKHVENHARAAEEQGKDIYVCEWDLCDFSVRKHSEFVAHVHFHAYHTKIKVHGASLSLLMKYPHCVLDSQTRNNISHLPTCYTCEWDDCDEKFNRVLDFYYHVENHVTDLFPVDKKHLKEATLCRWSNCQHPLKICKWALAHSQKHTGKKMIACFNCGRMHFNRTKYRDHCYGQLDVAYRRYQCETCYKRYTSQRLLNDHVTVHKLKISCELCPRIFVRKSTLAMHIRRVHLKERSMACGQCEYRAYTKQQLGSHIANNHGTNKLYRCDEFGCNATFKSDMALKRHISKHYNIPPICYACHICKNEYSSGYRTSKHLRHVHQVKPPTGFLVLRFKQDVDGIYRLNTYVDRHRPKVRVETQPSDAEHSECESGPSEPSNGEDANTELANNAEPAKVNTKINKITVVGKNTIAIDLGLDIGENTEEISLQEVPAPVESVNIKKGKSNDGLEPNKEPQQQAKKQAKKTAESKKVQEYTVMQRYLQSEN